MYACINNKNASGNQYALIANVLYYKKYNKVTTLSKNQTKLLHCLLNGQERKEQIIDFIWGGKVENDSKYVQLIRRTRNKMVKSGFPNDAILTVTNFGVCLNESPSPPEGKLSCEDINLDSKVIHSFHM
ncbi:winged helix-turn-helix domain-containing protein [Serratia fonticola]